ncbi:hypothetical protein [uncultured Microbacterium sp.]|uniref:hypothetical protein n=1 Tax=uncultured Microbacterium sp. TaxID=191216 RepID=UPI00262C48CD|nr:hypothetical protein [uncultured Microbacterium sp.]
MVYGVIPPDDQEALVPSYVPLPVGALSRDRSAVVGAAGHLFILEGTNSLFAQYEQPETDAQKVALSDTVERWRALVDQREKTADAFGARFVQLFVPDKSSVLDSGVPGLGPVTPLLDALERALPVDSGYLSARHALRDEVESERDLSARWLLFDSHTSARGSMRIASALAQAIGDASFMDDMDFIPGGTFVGDLGARFFGYPMPEPDVSPRSRWLDTVASGRELVARRQPPRGHTGLTLHWRTPRAPIDAKVLVFGNSFFGGGDLPRGINYWVSRVFREHRFVWSAEMLDEVIEEMRPDIVICQTVERFMPTIPGR